MQWTNLFMSTMEKELFENIVGGQASGDLARLSPQQRLHEWALLLWHVISTVTFCTFGKRSKEQINGQNHEKLWTSP